ncbi:CLIP-associating protein 1-like isoform X4 [Ptychodera flava]|uniref:CLIP-associating protein 1-like isoform X4 n=1 Tax=Ptychodera flava TaxID=63121 RepID=UPI003969C128
MTSFLDDMDPLIQQQDIHKRQAAGQDILEHLQNPNNPLECENWDKLVDGLSHWVNSSNYKVSLLGLEILGVLADRMKEGFRIHISTVLPSVIDRLGDSKDAVRDQAQGLIQKLMNVAPSPQAVFERLMRGFTHKNFRVREEVLLCLMQTINTFGTTSLSLSKIVPSICKLLGDPNSQVRDTAINTLVEIYRHVGEKVRIDLGKKGIPSSRLSIIYGKFDEVKKSGRMLAEDTGSKPTTPTQDEVDSARRRIRMKVRAVECFMEASSAARVAKSKSSTGVKRSASSASGSRPNTASSGAIDEELFRKSFEDVPEVTIYNAKSLEEDFTKIKETLEDDKNAWDQRVNSLKKIRSLVIAGAKNYDSFQQQVRLLEVAFKISANDLRSQVVREACLTLAFLSMTLGRQFVNVAEFVLPTLFNLVPNSAKIMSSSGTVCLHFIIKHTHSHRLIPIICSYVTSKAVAIRRQTALFLWIIFSNWDTHSLEKHVGILTDAVHKNIEDADSEVRSFGRKAFWGFAEHFRQPAEKLLNSLDTSKQKMLHGELSQSSSTGSLNIPPSKPLSRKSSSSSQESVGPPRSTGARRSLVTSQKTETQTDGGFRLGPRSNSDINTSAASRAKSRYSASSTSLNTAQRLPKSASKENLGKKKQRDKGLTGSNTVLDKAAEEGSRIPTPRKGRLGVSQSQPGSRSSSRSASPTRYLYGTYSRVDATGSDRKTPRKSRIPRSQGCSREASPNRLGFAGSNGNNSRLASPASATFEAYRRAKLSRHTERGRFISRSLGGSRETSPSRHGFWRDRHVSGNGAQRVAPRPQLAQPVLGTGKDAEIALAAALTQRPSRKRWESYGSAYSDDESDASSVCSIGSYGSGHGRIEDVPDILNKMGSAAWSERKEGLLGLSNVLRSSRMLSRQELKRCTEIFTRMFADPHGKVFSLFLETLSDFITIHKMDLSDWLYILLTRLLLKMGMDLLGSVHAKVERALDVVRDSFPYDLQFNILTRFIVDQTQTPNVKTKVALLKYMQYLIELMDPSDFVNSSETRLAVSRIISWTREAKSLDVRKVSQLVLIGLFELNTPEFSMMLSVLPKTFQDGATKLLHNHLRNTSNENENVPPRPRNTPSRAYQSRPMMSPRGDALSPRATYPDSDFDMQNMNSEEIYNSLRRTTAEIQNFSLRSSRDDLDDLTKDPERIESDEAVNNSFNRPALAEATLGDNIDEPFNRDRDILADIIRELSNHNERNEERESALQQLMKIAREDQNAPWEIHFKAVLLVLTETLNDVDATVRALALRTLRELVKNQPDRFVEYAELTILKVLEAHKDMQKEVIRAAEETTATLANSIPPETCVRVLCPLIQTADFPVNLGAIKMLTKVVELFPKADLNEMLPEMIPGLLKGYDHPDSSVRKGSVFCLVAIHSVIGDDLKDHLGDLSGSKMKLLNLYIKRSQAEKQVTDGKQDNGV